MEQVKRSRKSKMKKRPDDWDRLKEEIAQELGLWDKVVENGWSGLSAEDSGRLGGVLAARRKRVHAEAEHFMVANLPGAAPALISAMQSLQSKEAQTTK